MRGGPDTGNIEKLAHGTFIPNHAVQEECTLIATIMRRRLFVAEFIQRPGASGNTDRNDCIDVSEALFETIPQGNFLKRRSRWLEDLTLIPSDALRRVSEILLKM
ncbi:hypothetical protein Y032_0016g2978 [Ancylostoma ceylanicum]|uniref:Uncharacterized protein n=1 Tax=Ancylostoma ceylanicum TaxID=53326 RepID=A0A016V728_9BILA|nr:hypothetical protein Y032_0016g2978 [Ancylostoma ceylanicum]